MDTRALRWALNGLLLLVIIPMTIPSSRDGQISSDRFFNSLPLFIVLLMIRLFCSQGARRRMWTICRACRSLFRRIGKVALCENEKPD